MNQFTAFPLTMVITVIIIAYPFTISFATPTVSTISPMLAVKNNMLIKNVKASEGASLPDIIVFDKTDKLIKVYSV